MTTWRLEVRRLTRTGRLAALVGVFTLFGFVGPLLTKYLDSLLDWVGGSLGGATIVAPEPTVVAALQGFERNAAQVGLVVLVVVAISALAVDSVPQVGMFFRTRARSSWSILMPRTIITTLAGTAAASAGLLAAWYESAVLIGAVPVRAILGGILGYALLSLFVVSLAASWAQATRGTLGAVLGSLCTLIAIPITGLLPALSDLTPTSLSTVASHLANDGSLGDFVPAMLMTAGLSAALLIAATALFRRREPQG